MNTDDGDRIVVFGSEPEVYFYSQRRAATGYLYLYPLVERHPYALRMQQEMIREIEAGEPRMLVVVGRVIRGKRRPGVPHLIFDWLEDYQEDILLDRSRGDWHGREAVLWQGGTEALPGRAAPKGRIEVQCYRDLRTEATLRPEMLPWRDS